jgi:hypothetical protein
VPPAGHPGDIPPHGGQILTRTLMIEPAARAVGMGRPRADPGPQGEFHSRKGTSMTRRETRKIRSERRARIGTECLESRDLLSGLGAIAPAQLVSVPPSGSYQTALWGASGPATYMKITGPDVNHQTSLWGGAESFDLTKVSK